MTMGCLPSIPSLSPPASTRFNPYVSAARSTVAAALVPRNPRISGRFLGSDSELVGGLVAMFYFPICWVANHPNWLIFFRGVAQPPNQWTMSLIVTSCHTMSYSTFCPRLWMVRWFKPRIVFKIYSIARDCIFFRTFFLGQKGNAAVQETRWIEITPK